MKISEEMMFPATVIGTDNSVMTLEDPNDLAVLERLGCMPTEEIQAMPTSVDVAEGKVRMALHRYQLWAHTQSPQHLVNFNVGVSNGDKGCRTLILESEKGIHAAFVFIQGDGTSTLAIMQERFWHDAVWPEQLAMYLKSVTSEVQEIMQLPMETLLTALQSNEEASAA